MLGKYKDCLCIILIVTFAPVIVDKFIYPLSWNHRAGFFIIALAAIWEVLRRGVEEADQVQQVFEAKKIHVDGQYPRLVEKG